MKFGIRMLLLIFMLLNLTTSASITTARVRGWSHKVVLWTVFFHLVLAGVAGAFAIHSRPTRNGYRVGLSPAAWLFGAFGSYLAGLVMVWFVK